MTPRVYRRIDQSSNGYSYVIVYEHPEKKLVEFIDYCRDSAYYFENRSDVSDRNITKVCDESQSPNYLYFRMKGELTDYRNLFSFTISDLDSIDFASSPEEFYKKTADRKTKQIGKVSKFVLPIYFQGSISKDSISLSKVYDFYGNRADEMGTYVLCKSPFPKQN